MYNVHLPIMLESERQAVYRERKKELKIVVTNIETMCSLNCAELEVTRLEWISNLSIIM